MELKVHPIPIIIIITIKNETTEFFFHISPLFFSKRIYLLKLNVENLKTPFRKKNPAKSTKLFSAYSHRRSRNPPHVCHHVFPHTHPSMAANCACHFGNSHMLWLIWKKIYSNTIKEGYNQGWFLLRLRKAMTTIDSFYN